MVGIINYGLGNLGSIQNMLKVIGEKSIISADIKALNTCDRYILPGVGAFDAGMTRLQESGLVDFIKNKVLEEKAPILGICLGMQLLGRKSEEGSLPGLGLFHLTIYGLDWKTPICGFLIWDGILWNLNSLTHY